MTNDGYGTTTTTGPYNHTLTLMTLSIIDVDMHSLIDSFGLNDVIYIYIPGTVMSKVIQIQNRPGFILLSLETQLGFRIYILNRHK